MKKKTAAKSYKLYATNGCGSMIAEIAFGMAKVPFEIVDVPWEDTGWKSKALKKLNPLGQVPTLVLPDGQVMTETAAIVLHVADTTPGFELVPLAGHPSRAAYLRWQIFLVSAVYPTFTYGDVPERWVGESHEQARASCYAKARTSTGRCFGSLSRSTWTVLGSWGTTSPRLMFICGP